MSFELIKSCVEKRVANMKKVMKEKDVDVLILNGPEHIFHFSNFNPILFSHPLFFIFPAEGEPTLLVHSLRGKHSAREAVTQNILCHGKWGAQPYVDLDAFKALSKIAGNLTGKRVACDLHETDVVTYRKICKALNVEDMMNFSDEMLAQTMIKDEWAITMIKGAALLADKGVEVMEKCLREGTTEAEAVTEAQYAMRKLWQKEFVKYEVSGFGSHSTGIIDSLNCWVLSGQRLTSSCDCSVDIKPQPGELILAFSWGKLGGYHAENERSMIMVDGDEVRMRALEAMCTAQKTVTGMVKPGCPIKNLYNTATDIFKDFGFGNILPGRIGHGIGLSPHEEPSISGTSELLLQPGMVFTVEPGLTDEMWGSVHHSNTVVVTESGCEILTHGDNGLIRI